MTRVKLPYTTKNKLSLLIMQERAKRHLETGVKLKIQDIEKEIADFCKVTRDAIVSIKREISQPSLALAMRVSKYFKMSVEEIFNLEEEI